MRKTSTISLVISQGLFLVLLPFFYRLVTYLHPIVLGIVWICLTALSFFVVYYIRKDTISIPYPVFWISFILFNMGLLILLFFRPSDQSYDSSNLVPFATITPYLLGEVAPLVSFYNLAANIGLFTPWGLFFRYQHKSPLWTMALSVILIALIEVTQFGTGRGSLDIDDLILNALGVFLGVILYPMCRKVVQMK